MGGGRPHSHLHADQQADQDRRVDTSLLYVHSVDSAAVPGLCCTSGDPVLRIRQCVKTGVLAIIAKLRCTDSHNRLY